MKVFKTIFILGGPGSGKGTYGTKLKQEFGINHISVGDLLKSKIKSDQTLLTSIQNGNLISSTLVVDLIEKNINENINNNKQNIFLIDGFPRNIENYNLWNKVMGDLTTVEFILLLECPTFELMRRLMNRKRSDDTPESIKNRICTYHNFTSEVIKIYDQKNMVKRINAHQDKSRVWRNIKSLFEEL